MTQPITAAEPPARAPSSCTTGTVVGQRLRTWRIARRFTQEALAHEADLSPRHLSCLEVGKAMPSERMALWLSEALRIPLRDRNALLVVAGIAPRYKRGGAHRLAGDGPENVPSSLAPVVTQLIEAMPHPAYVLNGSFDLLQASGPARSLLAPFASLADSGDRRINFVWLFLSPTLREAVVNGDAVARSFLARLRNDCAAQGPFSPLTDILREVEGQPHVMRALAASPPAEVEPVLPLVLRVPGGETRWLTLMMSFGSPQDAMVEDLTIEQLLPADAATRRSVDELRSGWTPARCLR